MTPNLFIVGFQKCGSTTIFNWLTQHPDILGSYPKETFALTDENYEHFNHLNNISNSSFDWEVFFEVSTGVSYLLEASVCNFYQERAFNYISSVPNAKVIITLRDPIQRFISCYNYKGKGGDYMPINTPLEKYFELCKKGSIQKEILKYGLEHGKYLKYLDRWKSAIPEENIYVTSLEKFTRDNTKEKEQILEFLELEEFREFEHEVHMNQTQAIKNERIHLLIKKIFRGRGLGNSKLSKLYSSLNMGKPQKTLLSKQLRDELEHYYAEEYKELSSFFS